jgi:pyruvate/2-oxoglutarate dehydrogenase complex dihydrolipoamide acyltransferase (E2) component
VQPPAQPSTPAPPAHAADEGAAPSPDENAPQQPAGEPDPSWSDEQLMQAAADRGLTVTGTGPRNAITRDDTLRALGLL